MKGRNMEAAIACVAIGFTAMVSVCWIWYRVNGGSYE